MKSQFDYNTLFPRIKSDPDIQSTAELDDFLSRNVMSKITLNSKEKTNIYNVPTDIDLIKGATSRPGFEGKFVDSKLSNSPAEDAEFEVLRDDTIPLSTYRQMERDPVIQLAMLILKGWITGLKHTITCPDEQMRAVVQYIVDQVYADVVRDLLQAVIFGFSFGEKVWKRQDLTIEGKDDQGEVVRLFNGKVVLFRKIKFIDPLFDLRFFKDNKTDELSRVTQAKGRGEVSVTRDKLVWFALDRKYSELFGNSRLKNVYEDWYFTKINKQQMLRHVERVGSPPLEVRYPEGWSKGTNDELVLNRDIAIEMAQSFLNSGAFVAPSERDDNGEYAWKIGFQDTANPSAEIFLSILDFMAKRMSDGIGVPSSLSHGDSNFAEAQAQAEMLIVVVEDLVEQIQCVIQRDIVDYVTAFNFGPEFISQVEFTIDKSGLGRRALFRDIFINTLRISGAKSDMVPSLYPDLGGMMDELGIPKSPFLEQHVPLENKNSTTDPNTQAQKNERDNDPDQNRPNKSNRNPSKEKLGAQDNAGVGE